MTVSFQRMQSLDGGVPLCAVPKASWRLLHVFTWPQPVEIWCACHSPFSGKSGPACSLYSSLFHMLSSFATLNNLSQSSGFACLRWPAKVRLCWFFYAYISWSRKLSNVHYYYSNYSLFHFDSRHVYYHAKRPPAPRSLLCYITGGFLTYAWCNGEVMLASHRRCKIDHSWKWMNRETRLPLIMQMGQLTERVKRRSELLTRLAQWFSGCGFQ